jgi:hypothetical protein
MVWSFRKQGVAVKDEARVAAVTLEVASARRFILNTPVSASYATDASLAGFLGSGSHGVAGGAKCARCAGAIHGRPKRARESQKRRGRSCR